MRLGYPSDVDLTRDERFAAEYEFTHLLLPDGRSAPIFRRREDR